MTVCDTTTQFDAGSFSLSDGFALTTSGYYTQNDIAYQFALADAFTICDGYHCSILTGTDPNRIVFWSGSNFNPELRKKGINRIGNLLVPNRSYCLFEDWMAPLLDDPALAPLIELGIAHEQQHQELLLMDLLR